MLTTRAFIRIVLVNMLLVSYSLSHAAGYSELDSQIKQAVNTNDYEGLKSLLLVGHEAGYKRATHELWVLYSTENDVLSKDLSKAFRYADFAVESDYPPTLNSVGVAYIVGDVLPVNIDKAIAFLERAAQYDYAQAGLNLASLYANKRKNDSKRRYWTEWAADRGEDDSQYNLGYFRLSGEMGYSKDYVEAYKWFTLARQSGNPHAADNIAVMEDHLISYDEQIEAIRRANEWSPKRTWKEEL